MHRSLQIRPQQLSPRVVHGARECFPEGIDRDEKENNLGERAECIDAARAARRAAESSSSRREHLCTSKRQSRERGCTRDGESPRWGVNNDAPVGCHGRAKISQSTGLAEHRRLAPSPCESEFHERLSGFRATIRSTPRANRFN